MPNAASTDLAVKFQAASYLGGVDGVPEVI